MILFGVLLICLAGAGGLLFFIINPLIAWLAATIRPVFIKNRSGHLETVTIITVVRNGRQLIGPKLDNTLELDLPGSKIEIIIHSDGSTDGTTKYLQDNYRHAGITLTATRKHRGKNFGLNQATAIAGGSILVFTDADALLDRDVLPRLLSWFNDPAVGGVCGRRILPRTRNGGLRHAQKRYVHLDTMMKAWETKRGKLTSNDGKIYAIRHELMPEIPNGVTDDLYVALSVVSAGKYFIFDTDVKAEVAIPSRSARHEIYRRRRIVSTSLRGISCHRELFNPFRFGIYGLQLFLNKVLRRLLPVMLILFYFGSMCLSTSYWFAVLLVACQTAVYGIAALNIVKPYSSPGKSWHYFEQLTYACAANLGMLLGLIDFMRGKVPSRWEPNKEPGTNP